MSSKPLNIFHYFLEQSKTQTNDENTSLYDENTSNSFDDQKNENETINSNMVDEKNKTKELWSKKIKHDCYKLYINENELAMAFEELGNIYNNGGIDDILKEFNEEYEMYYHKLILCYYSPLDIVMLCTDLGHKWTNRIRFNNKTLRQK